MKTLRLFRLANVVFPAWLFLHACAPATAGAESEQAPAESPPAFVEFLNATGLGTPLAIAIGERPLTPDGLANGASTGGLVLLERSATFQFSVPGAAPLKETISLPAGATGWYVVVARPPPQTDEAGSAQGRQPEPPALQLGLLPLRAKPGPDGEWRLHLVSFLAGPETKARLGSRDLMLERDAPSTIDGYAGQPFRFGAAGGPDRRFQSSEPGTLVAAIVPAPESTTRVVLLRLLRYSYP